MRAEISAISTNKVVSEKSSNQPVPAAENAPSDSDLELLRSIAPEDSAIRRRAVSALLRALLANKRNPGR
jgi:hypothetical protein